MERKNKPRIEAVAPVECEEESEEPLYEFDLTTANVEAIDGAMVKKDEDMIKLLFYQIRPYFDGEVGKCRGVLEGRMSKIKFLELVDELNRLAATMRKNEIGFDLMYV